ncbi:hypothetical protein JW916_11145 [Candidatus Sumerlaeota bacterium]|nr:hypothetical protein [Candidatus Sumerlaeota bacterium]
MKRTLFTLLLSILAAVTVDSTVGPIVWGEWVQLHFVAATVALWGMKKGAWMGWIAGWTAASIASAVSNDPLGISIFSLGAVGIAAGLLARSDSLSLSLPWLDAPIVFLLVVGEHVLNSAAAWMILREAPHLGLGGMLFTGLAVLIGLAFRRAVSPPRRRPLASERTA